MRRYELDEHIITRHVAVGRHEHHDHRHAPSVLTEFAGRETVRAECDLYPPGLVSVRTGGGYEQLVIVEEPRVTTIIWGRAEHDAGAGHYLVAQPYRILIGEWAPTGFLGGRLFYSPTPILDLDAPLYHANVPNLNCAGYRGTAVGWICLYHDGQLPATVAKRAVYLGRRLSGNEAYNTGNMRGTDGPSFYAAHGAPEHLVDPGAWEAFTHEHGVAWVRDAPWIPVTVAGVDEQTEHRDGGVPLTLGMAMTGNAPYYYTDRAFPRVYNAIARDLPQAQDGAVLQVFDMAFSASPVRTVAEVATGTDGAAADADHDLGTWVPGPVMPNLATANPEAMTVTVAQAGLDEAAANEAAANQNFVELHVQVGLIECGWCGEDEQEFAFNYNGLAVCQMCQTEYFSVCSSCLMSYPSDDMSYNEFDQTWLCATC